MHPLEKLYSSKGGLFVSSAEEIKRRLQGIKAFVFDWDGVFNSGEKSSAAGSHFSEVDSMGINLLRFSYFLHHKELPIALIISGEKNDTAFYFSEREGFTYSFYKVAHKLNALNFLCEKEGLQPSEVAYFFDDVLDVPIAERCGLRIQINQGANPLFADYCIRHKLVDYLTANRGGQFALREATELLMCLSENYDDVIRQRVENTEIYQRYIGLRRLVKPKYFTLRESQLQEIDPRS